MNFSYKEESLILLQVSDFTRLLIKVKEYERFQNNYLCNNTNSFIRHRIANLKRFCFYCDLSAFEQHLHFQALCNFFGQKGHGTHQVWRFPYTYAWKG